VATTPTHHELTRTRKSLDVVDASATKTSTDWQARADVDRLHGDRLARARQPMEKRDLGALVHFVGRNPALQRSTPRGRTDGSGGRCANVSTPSSGPSIYSLPSRAALTPCSSQANQSAGMAGNRRRQHPPENRRLSRRHIPGRPDRARRQGSIVARGAFCSPTLPLGCQE
jgi:hypothetical protein